MEKWNIYEAYGAWIAEEAFTYRTVWALTLDELKELFNITN